MPHTSLHCVGYRTDFGQQVWLSLNGITLPMVWIADDRWAIEVNVEPGDRYHFLVGEYTGTDPGPDAKAEWGGDRIVQDSVPESMAAEWRDLGHSAFLYDSQALSFLRPATDVAEVEGDHKLVAHASVADGERLVAVGDHRSLGSWDPFKGIELVPTGPNEFSAAVKNPPPHIVEYKYVKITDDDEFMFEPGPNRTLYPDQSITCFDEVRNLDTPYRGAGVAIPVFSLRTERSIGVGEFADLIPMAEWAKNAGLSLIQVLPINDSTSTHRWTDGYPYAAVSAFALHPIYIALDDLMLPAGQVKRIGPKLEAARALNDSVELDYETVLSTKWSILRDVFGRIGLGRNTEYHNFCAENAEWLDTYAAFCVIRDDYGTANIDEWDEADRFSPERVGAAREHPDFNLHRWVQFHLDRQLRAAIDHAHELGVVLKGDLPIGVNRASIEVWSNLELFDTSQQAGAPPDAFSADGQNWQFPTYRWDRMAEDGYEWWRNRLARLDAHFDAMRIDHILGFFRIWSIPIDQVTGVMGRFDPAMPYDIGELAEFDVHLDLGRMLAPVVSHEWLVDHFGDDLARVDEVLSPHLTQRAAQAWVTEQDFGERAAAIEHGLFEFVSNRLAFADDDGRIHPRCMVADTESFALLSPEDQAAVEEWHNDFYYVRHNDFWATGALEKLMRIRAASTMLICGEDLGMVPASVPQVMEATRILALEVQRMPKGLGEKFSDPRKADYLNVVTTSSHDTSTLRGWWQEEPELMEAYWTEILERPGTPPEDLDAETAAEILDQHLSSDAMWAIFPLQDLLAIDAELRNPDIEIERINVPANFPHRWDWRMHLTIDQLAEATDFTAQLKKMVTTNDR